MTILSNLYNAKQFMKKDNISKNIFLLLLIISLFSCSKMKGDNILEQEWQYQINQMDTILGHIETKNEIIIIGTSEKETIYTVIDKSGKVLVTKKTKSYFKEHHPDLFKHITESTGKEALSIF